MRRVNILLKVRGTKEDVKSGWELDKLLSFTASAHPSYTATAITERSATEVLTLIGKVKL